MRTAFRFDGWPTEEQLVFAAQLGCNDIVINTPSLPARNGRWELSDLLLLKTSVESVPGLRLAAIETPPVNMRDHIITGGPLKAQQTEAMLDTVRNVARAGIPVLTMSWKYPRIYRTPHVTIRGGAVATSFDYEQARSWPKVIDSTLTEEKAWRNLEDWINAVTPVAEKEGIKIGYHPNDPPVPVIGGVPQLLRSFDAFKRLLAINSSPNHGVLLCQGPFSQMADAANGGIYEAIDHFTKTGRVYYVHFRNVSSPTPHRFHEEFINTGHVDMLRTMRIYKKNGFTGWFQDDHVPHISGDTAWGHRAHAHATGYIQALIDAVMEQGP